MNSVAFQKLIGIPQTDDIMRASRVYDSVGKKNEAILWDERTVRLEDSGEVLEVRFAGTEDPLQILLPGIDYINYVDAVPMKMGADAHPALVMLITGRATGRRDLLAVISRPRELVYLELLERTWDFRTVSLAIAPSATGDQILVGSELRRVGD